MIDDDALNFTGLVNMFFFSFAQVRQRTSPKGNNPKSEKGAHPEAPSCDKAVPDPASSNPWVEASDRTMTFFLFLYIFGHEGIIVKVLSSRKHVSDKRYSTNSAMPNELF